MPQRISVPIFFRVRKVDFMLTFQHDFASMVVAMPSAKPKNKYAGATIGMIKVSPPTHTVKRL